MEVAELPEPEPGAEEVLVRTSWSLLSPGTEQAVSETAAKSLVGKARDRPDQVRRVLDKALRDGLGPTVAAVRGRLDDVLTPGYSSAGVVERCGAEVRDVRPGDRVACIGANLACHAELVTLPAPLCIALPPTLDARWGAFAALGAIAAHGVRTAGVDAGSVVLVIGLGLIGQLTAQLVTAAGGRAVAVDTSPERVELARRLGAVAGAGAGDDAEPLVRSLTEGQGADSVIVAASSKDSAPIELAGRAARDRAVVSVVGAVGLDVPRADFYEKELQLRMSRSYGPGRYDAAYEQEGHDYPIGYVRWTERRLIRYFLEEVAEGRVRLEDLVTHEFPIEHGTEAYEALGDGQRLAILLRYERDVTARPAKRATASAAPGRPRGGRLGVGVVGPGLFARGTLLPALAKEDVELVAVAGSTGARAFGVARRWEARYAAADYRELIDDPSVDVVVIATRHDSHAPLAAEALERGKAVFLEKPLAIDGPGLDRLLPLLEEGGRLVVDFNRSCAPATVRVARHLSGRREPVYVGCRVNAGFLEEDHWLRDPQRGGGRLVGEGCHFFDLCSRLVERPLASVQTTSLGSGPSTLPGDNFVITLGYADGSVASLSYIASGSPRMRKERVEVLGGDRSAVIDDFRRVELFGAARAPAPRPRGRQDKGHAAMLSSAFRFFREGGTPPVPYERLAETTRATLIARDALAAGRPEAVSLGT